MAFIETSRGGRPLYRVRWNYRDPSIDGRRFDERSFRKRSDAVAWHREVSRKRTGGARLRVVDIAYRWLEDHVAVDLEAATLSDYEQAVRLRIAPGLGAKVADRLTPRDVSEWRNTLLATGYPAIDRKGRPVAARPASPPVVNKTLRAARAMIRWARAEGLTTCTAFDDVRGVKDRRPIEQRRPTAHAYTTRELDRIVAACDTMLDATLILTGAHSGLRRSELFALKWDAVDLAAGLLDVKRALTGRGVWKDPKTHERRVVPVWAPGIEQLRIWREHAPTGIDLVFPTIDGRTLHYAWDSTHLPGIRTRSGLHVQLNELRDTYASTLIAAGASDVEITIALGHKDVQTTRTHYAEWLAPSRELIRERANMKLAELRDAERRSSHRSSHRSR